MDIKILDDICFSYGQLNIFNRFSFSIDLKKTTCLLGASGTGKSSILRLLAGLEKPMVGKIATEIVGQISYMPQQDSLLPWMTVLENVLLGDLLRGQAKPEPKRLEYARLLLAEVGLSAAEKYLPHQLSGGMKQRAALVRTLLEDKSFILMDEPFSAVDAFTRLKLQDLSVRLFSGRTVILVTHDPIEALRLADEICILSSTPARVEYRLTPPGKPPRNIDKSDLWDLHTLLLEKIANAN